MSDTKKRVEQIVAELNQPINRQEQLAKKTNGQTIANQLLGRNVLKELSGNTPKPQPAQRAQATSNPGLNVTVNPDVERVIHQNNHLYMTTYYRDIPVGIPVIGHAARIVKKVIRRSLFYLIQPTVDEQNRFNASVVQSLNGILNEEIINKNFIRQYGQSIQQLQHMEQQIENQMHDLSAEVGENHQEIADVKKQLDISKEQTQKKIDDMEDAFAKMKAQLEQAEEEKRSFMEKADEIMETQNRRIYAQNQTLLSLQDMLLKMKFQGTMVAEPQKDDEIEAKTNTYEDIDYRLFEEHFRGTEEEIMERQSMYVPYFQGHRNVLDLGCGRGEFLKLMKKHGISAKGVDLYQEFAQMGCQNGLEVEYGDAIDYLINQEDGSLGGIFSAQLVEHLSVKQINTICVQAYKKLKEGACIVLETPNPCCLSIYTNAFYIDPSHTRPVHPETLKYFLENAGFKRVEVVFTECSKINYQLPMLNVAGAANLSEFNDGINFLSNLIFGSQDYAIVAYK